MNDKKLKKDLEAMIQEWDNIQTLVQRQQIKAAGLRKSLESVHSPASPKGERKKAVQLLAIQAISRRRQHLNK